MFFLIHVAPWSDYLSDVLHLKPELRVKYVLNYTVCVCLFVSFGYNLYYYVVFFTYSLWNDINLAENLFLGCNNIYLLWIIKYIFFGFFSLLFSLSLFSLSLLYPETTKKWTTNKKLDKKTNTIAYITIHQIYIYLYVYIAFICFYIHFLCKLNYYIHYFEIYIWFQLFSLEIPFCIQYFFLYIQQNLNICVNCFFIIKLLQILIIIYICISASCFFC